MRKFNEREKEIIKYLSLIDENTQKNFGFYLQEIFFKEDKDKALYINIEEKKALLFLKKEKFDDVKQRNRESFYFLEALNLIHYLRNERLITIIPSSNSKLKRTYFVSPYLTSDGLSKEVEFINGKRMILYDKDSQIKENDEIVYLGIHFDEPIYSILETSILGMTFISEELKQLVQNNFETDEEIRFKETLETERKHFELSLKTANYQFRKTQIISWISIGIAIILGLWGILNRQTSTVKIDESQYKQVIQQVDELKDQLKTYESKIDSLKVQINNNARTQKSPL